LFPHQMSRHSRCQRGVSPSFTFHLTPKFPKPCQEAVKGLRRSRLAWHAVFQLQLLLQVSFCLSGKLHRKVALVQRRKQPNKWVSLNLPKFQPEV
jgi:hypothetical protein